MPEDPLKLWQHIHGASSHFPTALLIVSFLFDVVAIRKPELRVAAFWLIVMAALGSIPSAASGLFGYNTQLESYKLSTAVVLHRNIALIASSAMLVLAGWRIARKGKLDGGELMSYLTITFLAIIAISFVGWLGGLVSHGY